VAASRYSQRVDLKNWNSSHALAVMSVPPGSRVLDLGTADGSVARALKDRGCTVWGIESDERAADAASQVCDRVIVADLETPEAFDRLAGETFDVVLALDVLEHLREPTPVLRRAATHLTPKGVAIVSIPNVTHGALRLSLLEGRFNYTEQGLLDRTHLRFFDRRSAERLMAEAGLTIAQNFRVRRELDETEIAVSKDGLSSELLDSLASDPDATTYQFVFVGGLKDGLPALPPGGMLAERLIAENGALVNQYRELETQYKRLETYAKGLEAERAAGDAFELKEHHDRLARTQALHDQAISENQALLADRAARIQSIQLERDELRQELERRIQEAHALHADFRQSKAEVVFKDAYVSELRQQVDSLAAERDTLRAEYRKLSAKRETLLGRCNQLVAERKSLLARQDDLENTVRELRTYTSSAGFRIVEGMIRRLRSFPVVFKPTKALARKIAGRGASVD
jgi:2-polyprenyl-3-methyl-5-hydroxy-6-metoxy-1,4-benzoquinol methylase